VGVTQAGPSESDTCRDYVLPRLRASHWAADQIIEQYPITDGRIVPHGRKHRRGMPLRADYVLEFRPGVAVAVIEAKREYAIPGKGLQQAKRYGDLLDIPFRYSTNGKGIVEDDRDTGLERDDLMAFPSPDDLWRRYRAWKGIVDETVAGGLLLPFNRQLRTPDGRVKEPRYYQSVAINRAVKAILSGDKRALLTMAIGTGKTFVSLQIVWKLWNSEWRPDRKPRVLYLADRNILVDQPMEREYVPAFGEGPIWKLRGEAKAGREIYFGLYQSLIGAAGDPHQPPVRRRGGEVGPRKLPGEDTYSRDGLAVLATRCPAVGRRRAMRDRRSQRCPLRRWSRSPDQGGPAQRVQPAHRRAAT
jgi:type I restriction enzyme R subunit